MKSNSVPYIEPCYLLKLRDEVINLNKYRESLLKIETISDDAIHNDMLVYFDRHLRNKIEQIKNKMIEDER